MEESTDVPATIPLNEWLRRLSQPSGSPGGGAACGVMLATSAGLLHMVAEYTDDRRAEESAERLASARRAALDAAQADSSLSAALGAALALPNSDPRRDSSVADATVRAARSSVVLGDVGVQLLPEAMLLADIGNRHLGADLAIAAEALGAALFGAGVNLVSNLRLADKHGADEMATEALNRDIRRFDEARTRAVELARAIAARYDG